MGKTEEQLKGEGVAYKVGTFPFMANSRARAMADADGLVKFLIQDGGAHDGMVLGIHIIASSARHEIPRLRPRPSRISRLLWSRPACLRPALTLTQP